MYSYLVIGLESTGTRIVSKLLACNLGIIDDISEWNGFNKIVNKDFSVTHRSMPYGTKEDRHIPDEEYINKFDCVVITTRDLNSVVSSKLRMHDKNLENVLKDNENCMSILRNILLNHDNCHIFSYESMVMLQEAYLTKFLSNLGISMKKYESFYDGNKKYFVGEG